MSFFINYSEKVIGGDDISVFVLDPTRKVLKSFDKQIDGTHQVQQCELQGI